MITLPIFQHPSREELAEAQKLSEVQFDRV
jgi:hypothetical protein